MILNSKPDTIIFHYNKKHSEDVSIPPWMIKFKGKTYYINHLDIMPGVGFSSKETPNNPSTKGSMKIKGRLEITEDGTETLARIF